MTQAHDGAYKLIKHLPNIHHERTTQDPKLQNTRISVNLAANLPTTYRGLAVLFVGLHLGQRYFDIEIKTSDEVKINALKTTSSRLLERPGCQTAELHVAGVSNTTRHLLLQCNNKHPLLGHNAGCLSGTKEVSMWTKVVEEDLPRALSRCTNIKQVKSSLQFLQDVLRSPFIGHNQRKIRHRAIQLGVLPEQGENLSHDEWAALPVIRLFLHGLELGATDLLCFGMIVSCVVLCGGSLADAKDLHTPHLNKWLDRVEKLNKSSILHITDIITSIDKSVQSCIEIEEESTPSSCEDNVLVVDQKECLECAEKLVPVPPHVELDIKDLGWENMDYSLRPQRGGKDNIQKMWQLQSMVAGVRQCVEVLSEQSTKTLYIVDFCSGAGHLGIIIAHEFPQCQVVVIEAKWGSLRFAQERILALKLTNTTLCLTHLNGFIGKFDIGVSLHACGSATDMVLSKCIQSNAAIVSSPCCYGKIQCSAELTYPQSRRFKSVVKSSEHFIRIAKMADCEFDNKVPMNAVDVDRTNYLKDVGYTHVVLHQLKPLTCSPKNNLIVACK